MTDYSTKMSVGHLTVWLWGYEGKSYLSVYQMDGDITNVLLSREV